MERLQARGIALDFQAQGGAITAMRVQDQGHLITPLHRAPWAVGDVPATAPPHQGWLAGDFFCAPFGDASADAAPLHGWTANGDWTGAKGQYRLTKRVFGAVVEKHLTLRDNNPFVYQRHVFTGGAGALPVANHAMVSLPDGGHVTTSALRWCETPRVAPESDPARGRSVLAYPAQGPMAAFPLAAGGVVDLGRYPIGVAHEDFVIALASPDVSLGWTAVVRAGGDLFLSLRRADRLPLTMFWHSNGGRDYAPWSARHCGVLGVEEGVGLALLGLSAQDNPDPLASAGQPTALRLGGVAEVRHVIGALHWPSAEPVGRVTLAKGYLQIASTKGTVRDVPFDDSFFT